MRRYGVFLVGHPALFVEVSEPLGEIRPEELPYDLSKVLLHLSAVPYAPELRLLHHKLAQPSGALSAAFDNMPGDRSGCDHIPIVERPSKLVHQWCKG